MVFHIKIIGYSAKKGPNLECNGDSMYRWGKSGENVPPLPPGTDAHDRMRSNFLPWERRTLEWFRHVVSSAFLIQMFFHNWDLSFRHLFKYFVHKVWLLAILTQNCHGLGQIFLVNYNLQTCGFSFRCPFSSHPTQFRHKIASFRDILKILRKKCWH